MFHGKQPAHNPKEGKLKMPKRNRHLVTVAAAALASASIAVGAPEEAAAADASWSMTGQSVKFSVEIPPALRDAFEQRAEYFNESTVFTIVTALTWFADRASTGDLPPNLIYADKLGDVPGSSYPRTMSIKVDSGLCDEYDRLAEDDNEYGADRSSVVRSALCSYLSAAGTKFESRFDRPTEQQNRSHLA